MTATEREDAEAAERLKRGKEVLGLILEADLPFAQNASATSGLAISLRCCKGLRAATLRKRVRDWRPVRRFLLADGSSPFPDQTDPLRSRIAITKWQAARCISCDPEAQAKFNFVSRPPLPDKG